MSLPWKESGDKEIGGLGDRERKVEAREMGSLGDRENKDRTSHLPISPSPQPPLSPHLSNPRRFSSPMITKSLSRYFQTIWLPKGIE